MILIAGDGASGSSYLVWLLRELGFRNCPKGYELPDLPSGEPVTFELLRERRIVDNLDKIDWSTVDVIKDLGKFSMNMHTWVDRFNWKVDHVFITVRDLDEGIARRHAKAPMTHKFLQVSHKELLAMSIEEKNARAKRILKERLGSAIYACLARNYPYTILKHPDWVIDPEKCWNAIHPVLDPMVSHGQFFEVYKRITDYSKAKTYGKDT